MFFMSWNALKQNTSGIGSEALSLTRTKSGHMETVETETELFIMCIERKIIIKKQKYSIIYADPAWPYKCWAKKGKGRTAAHHYKVMSFSDIKALPVNEITIEDAVLFMWITFPLLPQALKVIEAWGFKYKTNGFTWVKRNKKKTESWFWGLGHYTRSNTELCLIATKGKGLKRVSASVQFCYRYSD